jgi:hypothetical protein
MLSAPSIQQNAPVQHHGAFKDNSQFKISVDDAMAERPILSRSSSVTSSSSDITISPLTPCTSTSAGRLIQTDKELVSEVGCLIYPFVMVTYLQFPKEKK